MSDPNKITNYANEYGFAESADQTLNQVKDLGSELPPMEEYKNTETNTFSALEEKIAKYKKWIEGAGAHSKLGMFYRQELVKLTDNLASLIPSDDSEFMKSINRYVRSYGIASFAPPWDLSSTDVDTAINAMKSARIFDSPVSNEVK